MNKALFTKESLIVEFIIVQFPELKRTAPLTCWAVLLPDITTRVNVKLPLLEIDPPNAKSPTYEPLNVESKIFKVPLL